MSYVIELLEQEVMLNKKAFGYASEFGNSFGDNDDNGERYERRINELKFALMILRKNEKELMEWMDYIEK